MAWPHLHPLIGLKSCPGFLQVIVKEGGIRQQHLEAQV